MFREKGYYTGNSHSSNFDVTEPVTGDANGIRQKSRSSNIVNNYSDNIVLYLSDSEIKTGVLLPLKQTIPKLRPEVTEQGLLFDSNKEVKFMEVKLKESEDCTIFIIADLYSSGQIILSAENGIEVKSDSAGLQLIQNSVDLMEGLTYLGRAFKTHRPPRLNGIIKEFLILEKVEKNVITEISHYFNKKWSLDNG